MTRLVLPSATAGVFDTERALWVTAERLPQFAAVFPHATLSPPIAAPKEFADATRGRAKKRWSRSSAAACKAWDR